jgi:ZIP family zinc transporter
MPEGLTGAVWALGWGSAAASGALVGAILGLTTHLRHRGIAAFMSVGAGVLLSAASLKVAFDALMLAGAASIVAGIVAGAATFSIANAALIAAKDRKRCGECKPQPSEAEVPGSGRSIALGTALDAVPEALVVGITLRRGTRSGTSRRALAGECAAGTFRNRRYASGVALTCLRADPMDR